MLFNGNNPVTGIVGVGQLCWIRGAFQVEPWDYAALSFRSKGTAVITVDNQEYYVNENEVLYMPQHLAYRTDRLSAAVSKALQQDTSGVYY